ncbi:MAG: hypothetical protein ACFFCE_06720 [Promethearchaeota archaeon]
MGNNGAALGIIAIILCVGVGVFVFFIWNGQNTTNSDVDDLQEQINNLESDFNNSITTKFVGIWDDLARNMDYSPHNSSTDWLIEFQDNNLTNPEYISVSNNNTRVTLLQSGWYRIHLTIALTNHFGGSFYWIHLLKDGVEDENFDAYSTSTYTPPLRHIDSSVFIYSNGTNYIEVNPVTTAVGGLLIWYYEVIHQFIIEYVAS